MIRVRLKDEQANPAFTSYDILEYGDWFVYDDDLDDDNDVPDIEDEGYWYMKTDSCDSVDLEGNHVSFDDDDKVYPVELLVTRVTSRVL